MRKEEEKRLIVTVRTMERSILHLTLMDRVRCKDIRAKTKFSDIIETINRSKWRWAGHLARYKDKRWSKVLTEWIPEYGRRKRGHQRMRWIDKINKFGGPSWIKKAQDRDEWKRLGEAYIQNWIETG